VEYLYGYVLKIVYFHDRSNYEWPFADIVKSELNKRSCFVRIFHVEVGIHSFLSGMTPNKGYYSNC
jgi:hypothetical protein